MLEWRTLSQRFINGSINQWRRRLQAVVQENGGHVELNTSATSCRHLYSITLFFVEWRKWRQGLCSQVADSGSVTLLTQSLLHDCTVHVVISAATCIFERPFVKRFALCRLCYRTVVCLSVCDVRALWPNGWTDQDETWHAGRPRPWPQCVMGTQHPLPKGHRPTIFGPYLLRPNGCMDQDATWYGAMPQPRRLCVRWGPSPPLNVWPMFIIVIVSCCTRVKRLYACAESHYLCFSNYRIWVKYRYRNIVWKHRSLSQKRFKPIGEEIWTERSASEIVSYRARVKYACARIHCTCFTYSTIEFWGIPCMGSLDVFICAKNRFQTKHL